MKKKQLIAGLIKSGLVVLAVLVLMGGAYMFISIHKDDLNASLRVLQNDTTNKLTELKRLQQEVSSSKEAYDFYLQFQSKDASKEGSFRKDHIRSILSDIKEDVSLNSLLFTVEPFAEKTSPSLRKEHAVVISTEVRIQFTAIDDIHAQRLVDEMEERFPGSIYYTKFYIERQRKVTDGVLLDISRGRIPDLVKGEIEFTWSGIKELHKAEVKEDEVDL